MTLKRDPMCLWLFGLSAFRVIARAQREGK